MSKKPSYAQLEQRLREAEKTLSEYNRTDMTKLESEAPFKTMFESANVGKSITSADHTVVVNQAFADMLGYTPAELGSMTWQELTPADEIESIQENIDPMIKGEVESVRFDKRYIHKNGSYIWADTNISAHRNSEDKLLNYITTVIDITERKQAEANLSSLINNRNESIWSIDKNFNYLTFNNFFKEAYFTAFNIELKKGLNALDILPTELKLFWEPHYRNVLNGEQVNFEFQNSVENILHHYSVSLNPIISEDQISGVSALSIDITEQRLAEQRVIEQSANMLAIMENTLDSIWTINQAYEIVYVNSAFRDDFLTSFGVELKPGVVLLEALPEVLRPMWKERYDRILSGERFEIVDAIDLGTHKVYIEVSFNPILVNNTVVGASFFGRDVTERKKVETALEESEYILRESQTVAHIGSYLLDIKSGHWECSTELDELFGIDSKYVRDLTSWIQIIHADDQHMMQEYYASHVVANHELFNKEYRITRIKDGANRWVHGIAELELDDDGNPKSMIGIIQDITERKQAEELRLSLEAKLREAKKLEAIGTMVGGVAHEFNNALQSLFLYAGIVQDQLPEEPALRDDFKKLLETASDAKHLVEQVMLISSLDSGNPEPIVLSDLIIDVVKLKMLSNLDEHKIELNIVENCPPVVGDKQQIQTAIGHVIDNATIAIADGGRLMINLEEKEHNLSNSKLPAVVQLTITDTGMGMTEETLSQAFNPFFTTREVGRGKGFGLSIVRNILQNMGGSISATSVFGEGSSFIIEFPVGDLTEN